MKNKTTLKDFLSSKDATGWTLLIGIIFLITNYQGIIFRANPDNIDAFAYPYFIQVVISHLDSLFFGMATAIIIFQTNKVGHKLLYCTFEAVMIFLNLNRTIIGEYGYDSQFWLSTYVAVFSGFTLFYLGSLAKQAEGETQEKTTANQYPNPTLYDSRGQVMGFQPTAKKTFYTAEEMREIKKEKVDKKWKMTGQEALDKKKAEGWSWDKIEEVSGMSRNTILKYAKK